MLSDGAPTTGLSASVLRTPHRSLAREILWTSKLRRFNQDSYEILHFVRTLESSRIPNRCGNYHSSRNHEPSATFPLEICGNYHEKVGATDYYLSCTENQRRRSTVFWLSRSFESLDRYKKRGRFNFRPPVRFKMKIRSGRTQPGRLLSIHEKYRPWEFLH